MMLMMLSYRRVECRRGTCTSVASHFTAFWIVSALAHGGAAWNEIRNGRHQCVLKQGSAVR